MKKVVIAVCCMILNISGLSAFAQDKVVVIPLSSSASSKMTAAASEGNQHIDLTTSNGQVARSITITVEEEGIIIVNASCYVELTGTVGTNPLFRAYITENSGIDSGAQLSYGDAVNTSYTYGTVSGTRAFAVSSGTYTYNLYVDMFAGTATLRDSHINGLFVPVKEPVIAARLRSAAPPPVEEVCSEGVNPDC